MSGAEDRRATVAFDVSTILVARPSGVAHVGASIVRAFALLHPDRPVAQVYRWARRRGRRFLPERGMASFPFITGAMLHRRCGLVHALDTRIPAAFRGPLVANLYDVISALPVAREKALASARFMARKRRDYRTIARRAEVVIAISRETKDRFLSIERPRGPVVVIPPGVRSEFLESGATPIAARFQSERYLLAVGAFYPRKNLEAALAAFRRARARAPDLQLALAGQPPPDWERSPIGLDALRPGGGVRLLGYLDPASLAAAYAGASAFLYLSHYEGFGLPVLEALACGAPVIAARRGGIPEAAGDAALLVDPDRPGEVDAALDRVLSDRGLTAALREGGRRHASAFTWEAAARAISEAHQEARALHGRRPDARL